MKSPEQQLQEWVTDTITFDGEGMVCVFSRDEFTRLASALNTCDSNTVLKIQRKRQRYHPLAMDDDICFPPGRHVRSLDAERVPMDLPLDQIVDWRMARNFFGARRGPEIRAHWLLQFSNLLEAIFAVGNFPKSTT